MENDPLDLLEKQGIPSSNDNSMDLLSTRPSKVSQNNQVMSPNEMNIIQRIGRNITNPQTRPIGLTPFGIVLSSMGIPEENILPVVGGIVGGMAGARVGQTSLGVGAGTGNLSQQAIKKLARGGDD